MEERRFQTIGINSKRTGDEGVVVAN